MQRRSGFGDLIDDFSQFLDGLVQPESEVSVVQNGSNLSAVSKVPRSRGLKPNYGSAVGNADTAAARRDQWAHLALWSNVWQNKV